MPDTTTTIEKRSDVRASEGVRKHGNVEFADPTNKKYPIDTPEHVRAAWSYINHKDNASRYEPREIRAIKNRIKQSARKHGVEISGN